MNKVVSGRYRILGIIGTGGMAVVYRAWDEIKKCEVALKVLRPEFEADGNLCAGSITRRLPPRKCRMRTS